MITIEDTFEPLIFSSLGCFSWKGSLACVFDIDPRQDDAGLIRDV
jgi:hypothetical protein